MPGRADFAGARMALTPTTADDGTTTFKLQVDGGSGASGSQPAASSQSVTPATDGSAFRVQGAEAVNTPATSNPIQIGFPRLSNGNVRAATGDNATATANGPNGLDTRSFGYTFDGTSTWNAMRGEVAGVYMAQAPAAGASVGLSGGQTTAASGSLVLKASAGNLYGFEVCAGASAGYLMLFDSATAPADGTVTPKRVYAIAANASLSRQLSVPLRMTNGIVLVFSSTGPFTKTASNTAFLAGDYV